MTGWSVWLIATVVYLLTVEPTSSFWDCGEFIASAYKLEVGHPPGAPLFMLLARAFMVFASPETAAYAANIMSALCSSFTILFLFWSITHLARRFFGGFSEEPKTAEAIAILGSGAVGALAYTFSDSFWFSATEGEVYALSSLFTAAVFWSILKWEKSADEPGSTRWLILIAYLMGLSIGVHLLNLLAIPAIAFVYYFRKYKFSIGGLLLTGVLSIILLGLVQIGVIQGLIQIAASFELLFVNTCGLPFNSGIIFYLILLVSLITIVIFLSRQLGLWAVNTLALSVAMLLIGYSSFTTIVVRSSANPPMDENDPENFFQLIKYLNREQYGDRPLGLGHYWDTPLDLSKQYVDGGKTWVKSYSVKEKKGTKDRRIKSFKSLSNAEAFIEKANESNKDNKFRIVEEYVDTKEKKNSIANYNSDYTMVFPRMYSSESRHVKEYRRWSNYKGYNEPARFKSPLVDGELSEAEFLMHIEKDILNGKLSKTGLEKSLKKLFAQYGQRLEDDYQIKSATEIVVKDPQTGNMMLAPLTEPRAVEALSDLILSQLEAGLDRGRPFVKRLNQEKSYYEYHAYTAQDPQTQQQALAGLEGVHAKLKPTQSENLRYFIDYQMGWMYFRYFMWNFAGKQNDIQGHGDFLEGNWLSGIDVIDSKRLGNMSHLTTEMKQNKGLNKFYFLPLVLGLIGLVFQVKRDPKGATVVGLLFVMTGIAIVVYLNQTPLQPRERDYAYVGSFYAFAIWIGLSVVALFHAARVGNVLEGVKGLGMTVGAGVIFFLLELLSGIPHYLSYSVLFMTIVAVVLYGIAYLMQFLRDLVLMDNNVDRMVTFVDSVKAGWIVVILMSVPILMGFEGWDDHSRAKRSTGVDFAKNYLNSLAPNAILFTNGDNDTFPLWYAQEVEGVRTDVRVCNLSLLNTDWYIDQMLRKAYESDPLPINLNEEQYRQGTRDVIMLSEGNEFMDINEAFAIALDDKKLQDRGNKKYNYLPTHMFSLPVDSAAVMKHGILNEDELELMVDSVKWEMSSEDGRPKAYVLKNHFAVLSMLANNNWERPIYFAVTTGGDSYLGLEDYFRLEGLAYRLVPIKYPESGDPNKIGGVETDLMYENVMNKWCWGGMDDVESGIYMDENNRRMVTNIRYQMANLSDALIEENDPVRALTILDETIRVTPEENVPYSRVLMPIAEGYMKLAVKDTMLLSFYDQLTDLQRDSALLKAKQITDALFVQSEELIDFSTSQSPDYFAAMEEELQMSIQVCDRLLRVMRYYHKEDPYVDELKSRIDSIDAEIENYQRTRLNLGAINL